MSPCLSIGIGIERPTSPRIVTIKATQQAYVDAAHCTVNTFLHEQPILYLIVPAPSSKSFSNPLSREEHKRPREQYLESLKGTLKQTQEDLIDLPWCSAFLYGQVFR